MKTEFLVKFDGVTSDQSHGVIVLGKTTSSTQKKNFLLFCEGATNRPQELDDAVIRRMVKRVYIPLPCFAARRKIVENLLAKERVHSLTSAQIDKVANLTEGKGKKKKEIDVCESLQGFISLLSGYSASDITALCKESAFEPIREISSQDGKKRTRRCKRKGKRKKKKSR